MKVVTTVKEPALVALQTLKTGDAFKYCGSTYIKTALSNSIVTHPSSTLQDVLNNHCFYMNNDGNIVPLNKMTQVLPISKAQIESNEIIQS